MNLSSVDVNLFVVLHAVLEERSATRAAKRLHVTQSAVSNALARLRDLLGDPLVVRSGRGLSPTPLAIELAPRVASAVRELSAVVDRERHFDPETATRDFCIACADNQEFADVPRLAEVFERRLPRATLRVVTVEHLVLTDGLAAGSVDVALAPTSLARPGIHHEPLYEEEGALVVRRDHPLVRARLSREQFISIPHVEVRVVGDTGIGYRAAKEAFAALGLQRHVAMVVPHFMTAALVVSRTDYLGGLPRRFAKAVSRSLPIRIVEPPFSPLAKLPIGLVWHDRTHDDSGGRFFRQLVLEALRDKPPARASAKRGG
jgi:DNA-binding transcriptional LysR family regulator